VNNRDKTYWLKSKLNNLPIADAMILALFLKFQFHRYQASALHRQLLELQTLQVDPCTLLLQQVAAKTLWLPKVVLPTLGQQLMWADLVKLVMLKMNKNYQWALEKDTSVFLAIFVSLKAFVRKRLPHHRKFQKEAALRAALSPPSTLEHKSLRQHSNDTSFERTL